jgi:DNA polymerase I-like protein with 3'-5' exonuclease and polymerase domains
VGDSEVIICVPLRHISSAEWWSTREEKMEVLRALVAFFNDPNIQLVGHNFAFDSSVLLRFNIMRDRRQLYDDTMLMHHDIIDCDLPHDLGFVAARYFEVPSWKGAADDKYYTEVTDHDLQLYNCLMHGTTVVMADGRREPIQNLVRDRSQEKVLSMSPDGRIEARAIVDWHKKRTPNQPWIRFRTDGLSKNSNGLTLTPDHEVFTQRGRVRADQLELGDEIYTSEVKWSKEQRCAALGTLLGDSSLRVSPIFRKRLYEAKTAYIEGSHAKSSNLTPFKVDALSPYLKYTGLTPGGERVIAGIPCKVEDAEKYSSTSLRQFASLVPLIYDENGQRRLRVSVLEALGPIGLAWWYMDDGCRQNGAKAPQWTGGRGGKEYADDSMCFAANRYPRKDIDAAVEWFRLNYGNTIAGKDKIIRLGVVASRKLAQEIAPYICETQRYKLPRHVDYPSYVGFAQTIGQPVMERITEIDAYVPSRDTRTECYKADTSYCITVEGNHNFFTSVGLVKNCRDVLTTMRLDEVLTREVYKYATTEQYAMDRRLAPVARDMGELGLFVDEVKRGELSKAMNAEAWARYTRLKEITNDPNFNANASRHIQNFLFRVKKLQPEFNSKGEAFQDGEDPSTNANALLALGTKQKLDEETRDFINNLFEYRAYKKLTGTYIDHLQVQYPDWSKHGEDIPMVPSVSGRIYYKFSKSEMKAHHAETGIWSNGRWDEAVVIPERPALSRLFTTYKLHVIPSGRMSTYPAVQNWPERGKANMRDMIVAPPGHVIVGADLDQVELRLYASISGDKLLLKAFNTPGMDPHAYNAASLFAKTWGKSLEDAYHHIVTMPDQEEAKAKAMLQADPLCYKQMGYASADAMLASAHKKGEQNKKKHRNIAKTFVYLETYGGEAEKLYMYMSMARDKATGELMFPGLREEQVHEWHNEWHKHHPETKSWQRTCAQVARVEGYTASPFGCFRKRFFPGGPNKHAAVFNHVIQASAAEVANSALLKIAEQIPYGSWSPFTGPCLQVHDYIGVYVPVQRAEEAKRIVEEAMCTTVFGIAITASAKVSERWSQQ